MKTVGDGSARVSGLRPGTRVLIEDVCVCGPDAWTAAVLRSARGAGVDHERLHRERFAW